MGFKTKYDLERGIKELFNLYKNGYTKLKIIIKFLQNNEFH